jgi:DNA-directed RNA polymerase subunit N (RpoN/RPB10)
LDEIGLKNVCCRRHFLSHVDIEWIVCGQYVYSWYNG